jgi:zeaxanthin glucosyltransferase
MKIAFVVPNVPGHLNPMTALARRLQSRNHDVVVMSLRSAAPLVGAADLKFVPCGDEELPAERLNELMGQLSKLQGREAADFTVRVAAVVTKAMLKSLLKTLTETEMDGVILDTVLFYIELAPIRLGIPYIHVSNALHFDYSGYAPLCMYDWPHETTPAALARNREGAANFLKVLAQANDGVRAYAETIGLKVDWQDPYTTLSKLAWLTQTPREFDFASSHYPPQFHYTGPFHDGNGRIAVEFPWERLTGEPLIYASMGTVQSGLANVFRTIVAAVAKHKGLQLVLSIGDQLQPEEIGSVPNNAIIVKRAPQLELLKQTSVCITHAGLNTVLEALAQGVPQVAIPVTNDQPGVAARIADKKTGVIASLDKLTSSHLSTLLDKVLNDSTYRDNAGKIQRAIAQTNGLSRAADLIEQSLGV